MPRLQTIGEARLAGLRIVAVCGNATCRLERPLDLNRLAAVVGRGHPLYPLSGVPHYSERLACPRCGTRGAFVWPEEPEAQFVGLGYKVNRWYGTTLMETVVRASSEVIANLAYDSCLTHYKGEHLTLQQGMRVLRESRDNSGA